MASVEKVLARILSGRADKNIAFVELCSLLRTIGFKERIKGDHHIFTEKGQKAPAFKRGMNGPLPMPLFRRWARRHPGEDILVREQVRKWTPFGRSSLPSGRAGPSGVNVSQKAVSSLRISLEGVSIMID